MAKTENKKYIAVLWSKNESIYNFGLIIDRSEFIQKASNSEKENLEKTVEDVVFYKSLDSGKYVFEEKQLNHRYTTGSLDDILTILKANQEYIRQVNEKYEKTIKRLEKEKPSVPYNIYMSIAKYAQAFRGIF